MNEEPCLYINGKYNSIEEQVDVISDMVCFYGVCILPGYFNSEFCEDAIRLIDKHLDDSHTYDLNDLTQ